MKTLIVDDNATERRLLEILLRPLGYCDSAKDGQEAMIAYNAAVESGRPFDLVCLDIRIPILDGHTVLQRIRDDEIARGILLGRGVKIIMTTLFGDSANVMHAFREQCDGYLVKPVSRKGLNELLLELKLFKSQKPSIHN